MKYPLKKNFPFCSFCGSLVRKSPRELREKREQRKCRGRMEGAVGEQMRASEAAEEPQKSGKTAGEKRKHRKCRRRAAGGPQAPPESAVFS